ncbi:MAG: dCTP deaminase [Candidatus Altiarchaeota archaeon]|nr:dCTP deaminase [Candidatus Altiarchaeota archaeon]
MILSRERISRLVREENLIDGYSEESLTGSGYDLRAGRFYTLKGETSLSASARILPTAEEVDASEIRIKPGGYILIETMEKVNMPKNLMARILPRSTLFRGGCSLITAVVDPGYFGTLTLGLKNLSECDFRLGKGARVGQIVFEEIDGETTLYDGRYQGGKVV